MTQFETQSKHIAPLRVAAFPARGAVSLLFSHRPFPSFLANDPHQNLLLRGGLLMMQVLTGTSESYSVLSDSLRPQEL